MSEVGLEMNTKWTQLYNDHSLLVRGILFRMGAEAELDDLVQECFIKIWNGLKNFRGDANMKTWVTRITINVAYDHFRRKGTKIQLEELDDSRLEAPVVDPNESALNKTLQQAMQSLSLAHRDVLVLHVLEENSVEEVAEILKISLGTVKSRLFHARKNLKEILQKRGIQYE